MTQQNNITVDQRASQILSSQISNYAQQNALLSAENEALWNRVQFLEKELQNHMPSVQETVAVEAVGEEHKAVNEVAEAETESTTEAETEVVVKPKKSPRRKK